MPSPAVNVDMIRQVSGQECSLNLSTNIISNCHEVPVRGVSRYREQRPASTTTYQDSSGWRPPTPWSHTRRVSNPAPEGGFWAGPNYLNQVSVYFDGAGWNLSELAAPTFPSFLRDSAVSRALLALKNQNINLSVAFAEAKETGELIESACRKTASLLGNLRRITHPQTWGRIVRQNLAPYQGGKKFLNDFLEFQYGARPLKQDVYGACRALDQRSKDDSPFLAHVSGRSREERLGKFFKHPDVNAVIGYDARVQQLFRCLCSLYYTMDNPLLASAASLGLTNPQELIWEKIPFSFVVDWFLPIGPWFSQFDAAYGWSFKSGTITRVSEQKVYAPALTNTSPSSWRFGNLGLPPYFDNYYHMEREVLSSSPVAWLPHFKSPISGQHVANAIALLVSRLRR